MDRDRARQVMERAQRAGRDPVEALDRAHLLLTVAQQHAVESAVLRELADDMYHLPIGRMLEKYGVHAHTPYDTLRVLVEWVYACARMKEKDQ